MTTTALILTPRQVDSIRRFSWEATQAGLPVAQISIVPQVGEGDPVLTIDLLDIDDNVLKSKAIA